MHESTMIFNCLNISKRWKLMVLLYFIISIPQIVYTQDLATVSGRVIDEGTGEPLAFANIIIEDTLNYQLITGTTSGQDGRFVLSSIPPGEYVISCSFMGYNSYETELYVGTLNTVFDIGTIPLQQEAIQVDAIIVEGDQPTVSSSLGERSYYMADNISQVGGSVLDAMRSLPGINVDTDGKLFLRGSDKVIILMDGKQSSLTGYGTQQGGLDNIPATNIERIEIINNPPAKYDASGMAGIINIVYKKELEYGLHSSIGFASGLGVLTRSKKDLPTDLGSYSPTPRAIPSLDLNFINDKIDISLQSEVLLQKKLPNNEFTTRYYDDGRITASQVPENRRQIHYIINGGVDYRVNNNNIFTFSGIYDLESHVDTAQVPYINTLDDTWNRYIAWNEEETTGYLNYALHYEHKFEQVGHGINADLQYTKGWEDETYYINDSSYVRTQGRDVTSVLGTEYTTSFSVDYTKPLRAGRLEAGTKLQLRDLPVDYSQERGENSILYPGLGDWTRWGESIYAGYLSWIHERANYDIEAGLRTEYTTAFYDMDTTNIYYQQDDTYDYFKLFPNVRFSYRFNARNMFSIFFNQRIDRPGEPELRMYAKSDDHELVKVGNPYLRPQYTRSFELGYKRNWESGSVSISTFYRFIQDQYMRVYTQDTTNTYYDVILKSYANTGEAVNQGVELIFNQDILEFWELSGSINYYNNLISEYSGSLLFPYEHVFSVERTVDNTLDYKLSNTISLPSDIQIQLTALYFAPKNIPQGRQLSRSSVDLGLKKTFWQGKGELNCTATDIFNKYGIRQEIDGDGFSVLYENYYETQAIRVGIKYNF